MTQFEFETELHSIKMEEKNAEIEFQNQKIKRKTDYLNEVTEIENTFREQINEHLFDIATIASEIACTTDLETRGKLIFKERTKQNDITNLRLLKDSSLRTATNNYNLDSDKLNLYMSERHQEYNRRRMELRKQFTAEQKVTYPPLETANWDGDAKITRE